MEIKDIIKYINIRINALSKDEDLKSEIEIIVDNDIITELEKLRNFILNKSKINK